MGFPLEKTKNKKTTTRGKETARKRKKAKAKKSRQVDREDIASTPSSQSTPIPETKQDFGDARVENSDGSFLLTDRSLTHMSASTNPVNELDLNSSEELCDGTAKRRLIMLESQLTASIIACEGETNENKRLRYYVELFESKLTNKTKMEKNQKNEIKRLMTDNDKLRKSLSRFKGMRKYVVVTKATNTEMPSQDVACDPRVDETNREKFEIFQRKMINVATSMISAIEQFHSSEKNVHVTDRINDCNNVFQQKETISSQRVSTQRPSVQRRDSVSSVPATRARGQTAAPNIPVVIGVSRKEGTNYGIQRDSNTSDLPSSESHRRSTQQSASRNECVVIGSSLVPGLGSNGAFYKWVAHDYPEHNIKSNITDV